MTDDYESPALWLLAAGAFAAPFVLIVALRVLAVLTGHAWNGLATVFGAINAVIVFFSRLYQALAACVTLGLLATGLYFYLTYLPHKKTALELTLKAATDIVVRQNVTDSLERLQRLAQAYVQ